MPPTSMTFQQVVEPDASNHFFLRLQPPLGSAFGDICKNIFDIFASMRLALDRTRLRHDYTARWGRHVFMISRFNLQTQTERAKRFLATYNRSF